ncbi:MFS transporter [Microbacterium hydrocarbonoxydans]|uniref:Predicted arabinose efflux permease, MFS family n=1 Tax=Microbacterium hydrocarbonoxydans TaxID=273678 RepID=A0A1H4LFG1_9MICO|nr:MFS transporter [Microbacterium hydrocarbonoxydans]SEB69266.1 Predicted arabinose efflux permease, MFS family [Microbacterium hydrocarbonoxydans]
MTDGIAAASIWDRERLWVSVGAVALIFLAAIEALAVTTVMPIVSEALDGRELYAVAFAGTLATSVIGMVAAGAWADARGPRGALYVAVTLFIAGLLLSGFAVSMEQFLIGRLVQGLGAGGQTVALYVVVARLYPAHLHGRVFAAFAAAWVVPSMVGPFLAGAVAEYLDWRWAFLGVAVLTTIAFLLIAVRLRGVDLGHGEPQDRRALVIRLLLAVVVATFAVLIGFTAELAVQVGWPLALASVAVIAVAVLPLLPRRTLRAGFGLPSVVLMRGIAAGAFFAAEAYIPYLLIERFGFTATWAGVALMLAAFAWAGASQLQGRVGERLGNTRITVISLSLMLLALACVLVAALWAVSPALVVVGWAFAGGGMGLLYPRLTVLTLAYSNPGNQGFNSSALSISDSTGSAVAIALAGLAVAGLGGEATAFSVVFAFCLGLVLLGFVPGLRLGHAAESARR